MTILENTNWIHISAFSASLSRNRYESGHFYMSHNYERNAVFKYSIDFKPPQVSIYYFYSPVGRYETIYFEAIKANIGKGLIWYFVCPVSHKRCKKLYFINGRFVHREAYKAVYYENQIMSHKHRLRDKEVSELLRYKKNIEKLQSKRLTFEYAGKATKRWAKYREEINKMTF